MLPWVTGYPHGVTTCGSSPASRWASAISWVLIVYPALVVGSASVTRCSTRPGTYTAELLRPVSWPEAGSLRPVS